MRHFVMYCARARQQNFLSLIPVDSIIYYVDCVNIIQLYLQYIFTLKCTLITVERINIIMK